MVNGVQIKICNLFLELGSTKILENINMTIKKGEIHCLIGPNGGGKTSLLRCLLGQVPYEGVIHLEYEDTKIFGYVPQVLEFERTLPITVEDFLAICYQKKPCFLGVSKDKRKYINEILDEVGLLDKRKRLLGNLSGGELQRLLLAQAINPRPNLLILDEPFTGIDSIGEQYFLNVIKKLKQEGITILWIHHNIKQVKEMADTVTCIKKSIQFTGDPATELTDEKILSIYV
ncbi:metal ABC transporter ATP-binding protein [Caviibacter abscessus]|uniref:metal ABC transporter ATP-binding protein n=1 Tax=Caviibacter abscessus TaxID=1766719 RepID=UPI00082D8698|nr:metal ABC transporter ATP-binding protein [Caviibacter abscessus]